MRHVTLKCPADFFAIGPRHVFAGVTAVSWHFLDRRTITHDAVAAMSEFVTTDLYSARLCEQFQEAVAEAVAYVAQRTHLDAAVNATLLRFATQGQRCIVVTVDGVPYPGQPIDVPLPTDPALIEPRHDRHLAHARILRATDGYLITYAQDRLLQLNLSWSEAITHSPVAS